MKKSYRVKKEKELQQVLNRKQSCVNRHLVVYVLEKPQQAYFQVGISAERKIGNAVTENAMKQKIHAGLFQLEDRISPETGFIVIACPGSERLSSEEAKASLTRVLSLAKVLDIREGIEQ